MANLKSTRSIHVNGRIWNSHKKGPLWSWADLSRMNRPLVRPQEIFVRNSTRTRCRCTTSTSRLVSVLSIFASFHVFSMGSGRTSSVFVGRIHDLSVSGFHGSIPYKHDSTRSARTHLFGKSDSQQAVELDNSHEAMNNGKARINSTVRVMLGSLMSRYGSSSSRTNVRDKCLVDDEWLKTRAYLYQAHQHLTKTQISRVCDFLDDTFLDSELSRSILQLSPRILRKNVHNFLIPTRDFLLELYGPNLFVLAVKKNPNLLLTKGVGYDADALDLVHIFLREELKLSNQQMSRVKSSAPFLFQMSLSRILSVVRYLTILLSEPADIDTDNVALIAMSDSISQIVRRLICSHPQIFTLSVEENLKPRVDFLCNRCGFIPGDMAKLLKSSSVAVLALSVEYNLHPTIDYLASLLSERSTDADDTGAMTYSPGPLVHIRKLILSHPQILGLSLQNLKQKVHYFDTIDHLGNAQDATRRTSLATRILLKSPMVFSLSIQENIAPTTQLLSRIWGVRAPAVSLDNDTGTLVTSLNITSQPHMRKSLRRLRDRALTGLDFRENNVTRKIPRSLASNLFEYPNILTLSIEGNIQPTLRFFNRTEYIRLDENWTLLIPDNCRRDFPSSASALRGRDIAASLFLRLLPRYHYYNLHSQCQATMSNDTHESGPLHPPMPIVYKDDQQHRRRIPLYILARASDRAYCDELGLDYLDYCKYKNDEIPRLKFSSQFETWLRTGRPIDVEAAERSDSK